VQTYGDYELESLLGKGSIGKVWLARHRRIGRRVALKVVLPENRFDDEDDRTEFYKRLQREAELCAALQHTNIVTLFEVGYSGEVVSYLATEYVAGESLLARLRRTRPLPMSDALSIAADLLRGLGFAHSRNVIHRDIKPANILVSTEGIAKIADFGIARPFDSSLTASNSLLGTPNYMSPEQVRSAPVTPRSDLFSVGVVMYEMLTGVRPFAAPELSGILYNVVNLDPPPITSINPGIPEPLAKIVSKLIAKSPAERYASAEEALRDLEQVRASIRQAEAIVEPPDDATTPLPTMKDASADTEEEQESLVVDDLPTRRSWVRRPVPAAVFWLVTLVLFSALVASVSALRSRIAQQRPAAVITLEQEAAAEEKRVALAQARQLASAAKYAEAVRAYDAFIEKYPESAVARTERAEAVSHLQPKKARSVVTSTARELPKQAPLKPLSRWDRFKRWFRGQ
jgi:serine/threonine-protein kinase